MPLDKAKARSYVEGARNAYRTGPRAEYVQVGANYIEEALNQLDADSLALSRALNENTRLQRELDDEKTAYRKLREQSATSEACVALLRDIAKSPKGAKLKAEELLKGMGLTQPQAPVPAPEPAKIVVN